MQSIAMVSLLLVAAFFVAGGEAGTRVRREDAPASVIPREFRNINIENYLKNERAVKFQIHCILDNGPCDRIGKFLKTTIPRVLENQCEKCDVSQKDRVAKLLNFIQEKYPDDWEQAIHKYNGGLVKPEDAKKLEEGLGVKLTPNLIMSNDASPAPAPSDEMMAQAEATR